MIELPVHLDKLSEIDKSCLFDYLFNMVEKYGDMTILNPKQKRDYIDLGDYYSPKQHNPQP